jgi:hypothetical protein
MNINPELIYDIYSSPTTDIDFSSKSREELSKDIDYFKEFKEEPIFLDLDLDELLGQLLDDEIKINDSLIELNYEFLKPINIAIEKRNSADYFIKKVLLFIDAIYIMFKANPSIYQIIYPTLRKIAEEIFVLIQDYQKNKYFNATFMYEKIPSFINELEDTFIVIYNNPENTTEIMSYLRKIKYTIEYLKKYIYC